MKKVVLILAVFAILFVTACGGTDTANTGTPDTPDDKISVNTSPEVSPPEVSAPAESGNGSVTSPAAPPAEADNAADTVPTDASPQEPTDTQTPAASTTPPPSASASQPPAASTPPAPAPEPPSPEPVQTKYKDGTYTGTAWGYESNIVVEVTIADDVITSVKLAEHADDDIYVQDAVLLIPDVIKVQSADVDAVSGATATSDGIKNAIKAALKKAEN